MLHRLFRDKLDRPRERTASPPRARADKARVDGVRSDRARADRAKTKTKIELECTLARSEIAKNNCKRHKYATKPSLAREGVSKNIIKHPIREHHTSSSPLDASESLSLDPRNVRDLGVVKVACQKLNTIYGFPHGHFI